MEIDSGHGFLPLELASKYYSKWDCDISCENGEAVYYKCLNGLGSIHFINGNIYAGMLQNGLMNGKGLYTWVNGMTYQGQFLANSPTGYGQIKWLDQSLYQGYVLDGKRHGQGEHYSSQDHSNYKGTWRQGKKQGFGLLRFHNGSMYEGEFKEGLRHGQGKMKYSTGNQYEGTWIQDKKTGFGKMNWFSVSERYEGEWANDKPNGIGDYFWFEKKAEHKIIKTIYKGSWKDGKREGFGCFFYSNGCRFEGYFSQNLKEGVSILTDEYGYSKIEHYKNDKVLSQTLKKKQKDVIFDSQLNFQKTLKLPQISIKKDNILQTNEILQNQYIKFIDIRSCELDDQIYNLLLRQNSKLRSWYKQGSITNSSKDYYTGMTLQGLWRFVKQLKIGDQFMTLAKFNREFSQGERHYFDLELPNDKKIQLIKKDYSDSFDKGHYHDVQWRKYFDNVNKTTQNYCTSSNKSKLSASFPSQNIQNIHENERIVLFRHFVTYIINIALLQHECYKKSNLSFRKCLQQLLFSIKQTFNNVVSNLKTQKYCNSEAMTNMSSYPSQKVHIGEEYMKLNKGLFDSFTEKTQQLLFREDKTVTVRQLYCLLCETNLLKQSTERMLFLEKIERSTGAKSSFLKKQNKNLYVALQKIALTSSHFTHILDYQMIQYEFNEILYLTLNRKIGNVSEKQSYVQKYKDLINILLEGIRKHEKTSNNARKKEIRGKLGRFSEKDKAKMELLRRLADEKERCRVQRLLEEEVRRQERERKLMKKEDQNVEDFHEEESEEYYD